METRYFEYSVNPADGKYTEVSEEQFITDVINSENRFFIPMGTVVFECSKEEYQAYRKERNHHEYLKKIETEKNIAFIPINEEICEIPALGYSEEELIEAAYISIQKQALRKAMYTLDKEKRHLLYMRYYLEMTQSEIAELIGTYQQDVGRKLSSVLAELHKLLENK